MYLLSKENQKKSSREATVFLERNIKGQFKFADRVNAEYVAVIGDDEIKSHTITVKNMRTGEQTKTAIEEMMELFR